MTPLSDPTTAFFTITDTVPPLQRSVLPEMQSLTVPQVGLLPFLPPLLRIYVSSYLFYLFISMRRSLIQGHNANRHLTSEELENNIGELPVTEPKVRELFDKLDVNGNNFLDFSEVKQFYKSFDNYGLMPSDAEIEAQIRKYAKRPDNKLSFDEFMCIVLSIAQR